MILLNTQVMSTKKHNIFHICKYIITNSTYNNYNLEFIRNGMIEMLSVFICEDDKIQLEYFRKFIDDAIIVTGYDIKITLATTNPNEIIEYIQNNKVQGLYYIDVKLDCGINGFELVKSIRECDKRAFVVFITGEEKDYRLSLDYLCEPLDYIIKDYTLEGKVEMKKRISKSLGVAYERSLITEKSAEPEKDEVIMYIGGKRSIVDMSDVIWVEKNEKNPKKVDIFGCNRAHQFIGSLKEVLEQLDNRFIQVGRFYIINKDKVKDYNITQKLITLRGDTEDSIAKTIQVSPEAMKTFLNEMYLNRDKSIKNRAKKVISKLFKKNPEEE